MAMEVAKARVGRYTWVIAAAVLLLTLLAIQAEGSIAAALDPLLPTSTARQMDFDGHGPPAPISAAIITLTGGRRGAEIRPDHIGKKDDVREPPYTGKRPPIAHAVSSTPRNIALVAWSVLQATGRYDKAFIFACRKGTALRATALVGQALAAKWSGGGYPPKTLTGCASQARDEGEDHLVIIGLADCWVGLLRPEFGGKDLPASFEAATAVTWTSKHANTVQEQLSALGASDDHTLASELLSSIRNVYGVSDPVGDAIDAAPMYLLKRYKRKVQTAIGNLDPTETVNVPTCQARGAYNTVISRTRYVLGRPLPVYPAPGSDTSPPTQCPGEPDDDTQEIVPVFTAEAVPLNAGEREMEDHVEMSGEMRTLDIRTDETGQQYEECDYDKLG